MMRFLSRAASIAVLVLVYFGGCSPDDIKGPQPPNRPPTAWLTVGPPEGSTVGYTVEFFWGGWDPDGDVSYYEYAITDNLGGLFNPADTTGADNWHPTEVKDSIFSFSADILADSTVLGTDDLKPFEFVRSHTFFIRSVDDRGLRSKPVYRSFTARNLSPTISVLIPRSPGVNLALVPPVITFRWIALDFVTEPDVTQPPDSVRSILVNTRRFNSSREATIDYIRMNLDAPEWTKWFHYDAPGDSGRFWQAPKPLDFGSYIFAVQAMDEAGAISPVFDPARNVKWVRVMQRNTGPVLTLVNEFLGEVTTSSSDPPVKVLDIPAGVPLKFAWTADASSYGGTVSGYRYGWDILDLNDGEQWSIDSTPFLSNSATAPVRTFFFGTHTFHVEVVDNSGLKSRMNVAINVVPFTQRRELLLIDDWDEGSSGGLFLSKGLAPNDSEHDAFWRSMLNDVAGWVPDVDVFPQQGLPQKITIRMIADYKNVIWVARSTPNSNTSTELEALIRSNSNTINILAQFMAAGGRVLVCGEYAMSTVIDKSRFPRGGPFGGQAGPPYPLILPQEIPNGPESFAVREYCMDVIDITHGRAIGKSRSFCRVAGSGFGGDPPVREYDGEINGLRAAVPMDATYNFPRLDLRPEVAGPGKWYRPEQIGLAAEIYDPPYFASFCNGIGTPRACFEPIYGLECLDTDSAVFGAPVAFWSSAFAGVENVDGETARSAVWGFGPIYFNPSQIKEALDIIMFDEWQLGRRP